MALEAVGTVELVLAIGVAREAHAGLVRAAAATGTANGVAHAPVRQPTCVAAVVAQKLPGGVHLAHLGELGTVALARLYRLVVRQLARVDQVVELTCAGREVKTNLFI